ncbi:hydroxyethylthiazole kinase [Advenella sp. RU8]|uniref:hydroxyethylthiazole kinase n=1 Tax=Advenella sp. RU8 TaxID=3399575 RepID=UPI003AAD8BD0
MSQLKIDIATLLDKIRASTPLVHHITNYVTVNDCANMTLAIGASPVMADSIREVKDMVSIASALVINIGTLNETTVTSMLAAGKQANEQGIPVVLDPVGAGATPYRTEAVRLLLAQLRCSVIRGNLSEMKVLAGLDEQTRGVDAATFFDGDREAMQVFAKKVAQKLNATIAITGAIDVVSDGTQVCFIENGRPEMSRVTGTGCMCSSLVGAFLSVTDSPFLAAVAAVSCMGIAGEIAHENLQKQEGNASYRNRIIDAVFNLTLDQFGKRARIMAFI